MIRRVVLGLAGSATLASAASAQVPLDSASRWVDSIFAPYASRTSPGCAVAVTRNGVVKIARAYGMADLAAHTPLTPDTPFNIASLSKQFTAMSIVLLAEDGKLSLDDSIRKWVPEVPSFGKTITLRELLNHTSGLRDYMTLLGIMGWPADGEFSQRQLIDLVHRQKSLNFAPGDEYLYSNTGYALLAVVVERASGESLRNFAAKRIFDPLGMTHTEFRDDHNKPVYGRAHGYETTDNGYRELEPRIDVIGDAGVYSTVNDLAKWDMNFKSAKVGGADGIAMLTTPGTLNNGQKIPYGFALALGDVQGVGMIGHNGSYGGYRSTLMHFSNPDVGVITLCNTPAPSSTLAEQVGSLALGLVPRRSFATTLELGAYTGFSGSFAAGAAMSQPADTVSDARRRNDQLTQIAGAYYSDELDLPITLVVRDGALYMRRPKASEIRFGSFATDLFTSSDKILLRVERGEKGLVTGFTLTINRVRDLEFIRVLENR